MTGKELVKKLQKDGWTLNRVNGSHHIMAKGNKTVSVPIHAGKDLTVGTLNKIIKDADLKG